MKQSLQVGELDIVVVAQNHNPSILNPDFLVRTKIVDEEWGLELESDALTTPHVSQVAYKSGTMISAELNRLVFRERNADNIPDATHVPILAENYVTTLPHVTYTAVGINVKGHVPFSTTEESSNFIMQGLLHDGPWMHFADGATGGNIGLSYALPDGRMGLSVTTAALSKKGDDAGVSCVMFQANFHRDLQGKDDGQSFDQVVQVTRRWKDDYNTFVDLVQNHCLGENT